MKTELIVKTKLGNDTLKTGWYINEVKLSTTPAHTNGIVGTNCKRLGRCISCLNDTTVANSGRQRAHNAPLSSVDIVHVHEFYLHFVLFQEAVSQLTLLNFEPS